MGTKGKSGFDPEKFRKLVALFDSPNRAEAVNAFNHAIDALKKEQLRFCDAVADSDEARRAREECGRVQDELRRAFDQCAKHQANAARMQQVIDQLHERIANMEDRATGVGASESFYAGVEPDENEPGHNRSWLGSLLWVAVAFVCVAVGGVLVAAVTGRLTEKQQLHLLGFLFGKALLYVPLLWVFFKDLKEYRDSGLWWCWLQFAAALVPYVGFWAWTGYFADHGAFIIWPVICFVAFWALIIAHGYALDQNAKQYAEAVRDAPLHPPEPTPGEPSDDELRRRGLL